MLALNPYSAPATKPTPRISHDRRGWRYFATKALVALLVLEVALFIAFIGLVAREAIYPTSRYVLELPMFMIFATYVTLWVLAAIGLALGLATRRWRDAAICFTIPMLPVLVLAIFGSS